MDRVSFIEHIETEFQWLIDLGFKFKHIESSIYFEKEHEYNSFAVSINWAEYDSFLIHSIIAYKRFNAIENTLQKITGISDYTLKMQWAGEIPPTFKVINDENHLQNSFYISEISEIEIFAELVKQFFHCEVNQFYQKYDSLNSVLDEMDSLPSNEKANVFVNTSNSSILRIFALKFYVNPNDAMKFYQDTVKELEPLKNQRVISEILVKMTKLLDLLS